MCSCRPCVQSCMSMRASLVPPLRAVQVQDLPPAPQDRITESRSSAQLLVQECLAPLQPLGIPNSSPCRGSRRDVVALQAVSRGGKAPQLCQAWNHGHSQGLRHFLFQAASHLLRCGMLARAQQLPTSPHCPLTHRWPSGWMVGTRA